MKKIIIFVCLLCFSMVIFPACKSDQEKSKIHDLQYGDYYYSNINKKKAESESEDEKRSDSKDKTSVGKQDKIDQDEKDYFTKGQKKDSLVTNARSKEKNEEDSSLNKTTKNKNKQITSSLARQNEKKQEDENRYLSKKKDSTTGTVRTQKDEKKEENKNFLTAKSKKKNLKNESLTVAEKEELKAYVETYQFTLKRGKRLKSFGTLNGPTKDYHFVQSPVPNSKYYYFISDRKYPKLTEDGTSYVKDVSSLKNRNKLGALEIMVCSAEFEPGTDKEIFSNPRFLNLKDLYPGDKLGFTLFYNETTQQLEMYFSCCKKLHKAVSVDQVNFKVVSHLPGINSEKSKIDRDPVISPDGHYLVFASNRNDNSLNHGLELFMCYRRNLNSEFSKPQLLKGTFNSSDEIFPTIYQSTFGTFIFFVKFYKKENSYIREMYSIEVRNGDVLPMVKFTAKSNIPYKYMTVSYSSKRGIRIMSSYPKNGYDLYRMKIVNTEKVKKILP